MQQHIIPFSDFETFTGYHYSSKKLKIGDIITSNNNKDGGTNFYGKWGLKVYNKIWKAYKRVANQLNLYFPFTYGFAYGEKLKHNRSGYMYVVKAPSNRVTKCNYDHSMLLILENSFFTPISLPYALKHRNALIKNAFELRQVIQNTSNTYQIVSP